MLTALQLTAAFPEVILENFYKKSRNSIESGKKDAPFGYVIPVQADMTRVAFIVNTLRLQGIEVGRATCGSEIEGRDVSRGIARDQARSALRPSREDPARKTELSRILQLTTYDDTGWTMGLMAHAKVIETADKAVLDIADATGRQIRTAWHDHGLRRVLRGHRQRLQQSDHAALSLERCRDARGREQLQVRRSGDPRRFVHRRRERLRPRN